jgi:transposase-like protein
LIVDLITIATDYNTEEKCLAYLEAARWPEGLRCIGNNAEGIVCGSDKITKFSTKEGTRKNGRKIPARHLYQCQECGHQFTAKTETLFNDSHLPLTKWFIAVTLITNAKKGLSALQLQRDLKVSYQTAWYAFHRIRDAMKGEEGVFGGTVEMDETFIGGRFDARRHEERQTHKQPVMGVLQRASEGKPSQVVAFPIPNRTTPVIRATVRKHVANNAKIYTDEWSGYRHMKNERPGLYDIVIHSKGEYVRGDVHTNGIEGFWSLFERQLIGQHHWVSVKHLQRYLNERCFSFNNRDERDLFHAVLVRMLIMAALPYAKLTAGPSASPRAKKRGPRA